MPDPRRSVTVSEDPHLFPTRINEIRSALLKQEPTACSRAFPQGGELFLLMALPLFLYLKCNLDATGPILVRHNLADKNCFRSSEIGSRTILRTRARAHSACGKRQHD